MNNSHAKHVRPVKKKKLRLSLYIFLGVLLAALLLGGFWVHRILNRPVSLFKPSTAIREEDRTGASVPAATAVPQGTQPGADPSAPQTGETASAAETPAPGQAASPAETAAPTPQADPLSQQKIVNIMLMGIDAFEDGTSTSGTMPHTDVCMVVSINFDTDEVSLISLARDTFTTTPGYYGYYKLNGVFNVGGGMDDPEGGFEQVCRTAEQWLGGISIPYYYAVDFQSVIDIVDAIGGIDYYVETPLYSLTASFMGVGNLHLDGKMVLAYLRMRQTDDGLDSSRTARQRKMLVAIFNKLKNEGKLSQVPALISAVNNGVYTNTTLAQTIALANYATKISEENIRSLSIQGSPSFIYDWEFIFIDQQKRIDIIEDVFGIEAYPVGYCTKDYEAWLHDIGFPATKGLRNADKVITFAEEQIRSGELSEEALRPLIDSCRAARDALAGPFRELSQEIIDASAAASLTGDDTAPLRREYGDQLTPLLGESQSATQELARACKYPGNLTWWGAPITWVHDPDINEIDVDFR